MYADLRMAMEKEETLAIKEAKEFKLASDIVKLDFSGVNLPISRDNFID